jgi:hypothetical protein
MFVLYTQSLANTIVSDLKKEKQVKQVNAAKHASRAGDQQPGAGESEHAGA